MLTSDNHKIQCISIQVLHYVRIHFVRQNSKANAFFTRIDFGCKFGLKKLTKHPVRILLEPGNDANSCFSKGKINQHNV